MDRSSTAGRQMASNWQRQPVMRDHGVTRTNHVGALDQSATAANHQNFPTHPGMSSTPTVIAPNTQQRSQMHNIVANVQQRQVFPTPTPNLADTNTNHNNDASHLRAHGVHPAQGVVAGGFSAFGTGI